MKKLYIIPIILTFCFFFNKNVTAQIIEATKSKATLQATVRVSSIKQIEKEDTVRRKVPNKDWQIGNWGVDESKIIYKQTGESAHNYNYNVNRQVSPAPDTTFVAVLDNGNSIPPDVGGAVGPNQLMTTLNTQVRIHDRVGNNLFSTTLGQFWSALPGAGSTFDPKVVYDPYENRWIMTTPSSSNIAQSRVYIGVSVTSDPLGEWHMYWIDPDPNDEKWFDYPNLGFNKNWISVGGIMRGGSDIYFVVFAIDKMAVMNGEDDPVVHRFTYNEGSALVPAYTYDPDLEELYYISTADGNSNGFGYINKFKLSGSIANPVFEFEGTIGVEDPWENWSYDNNGDFLPQLGSPQKLNSVDARMHTLIYRNNKLWAVHHIYLPADDPQRSAVQWWELDTDGTILQRGRVDDTTNDFSFAFSSIAVNANEDIFIGHGIFSDNQYAGAGYSYRASWDDPNTIRTYYQYKEGLAPYYKTYGGNRNRWGDYSTACVDPINDYDFWALQEYAELPSGGDQWGTWWAYVTPSFSPIADFSSDVVLLPVGESVDFSDLSFGIPTDWAWTFEEGTPPNSPQQDPQSILFVQEGSFDVSLIVSNELGADTIIKTGYITTSSTLLPEVEFEVDHEIICVGDISTFSDKTIYMPIQWDWQIEPSTVTFTDGTNQTSQNPHIIFDESTTYDVTLTAWNLNGQSSQTKQNYIIAGGYVPWFNETFEIDGFDDHFWTIENPDDDLTWELLETGGTTPGNWSAGVNIRDYFNVGERDRLISPPFNLENLSTASLSFQYAYAQRYSGLSDSLIIYVSVNCGDTWVRVFAGGEDGSGNFATHELVDDFWPEIAYDWCMEGWGAQCTNIDLTPWAGIANFKIAFETYGFYGNPLFLDNIKISQFVGNDEVIALDDIAVYPNPNGGSFLVTFPGDYNFTSIEILDQFGKIIVKKIVGDQSEKIEIILESSVKPGIYFIKVTGKNSSIVKKVVVL